MRPVVDRVSNGTNEWVAVVVDGEWRLVDVLFSVVKEIETHLDWEIIDDGGQVYYANTYA